MQLKRRRSISILTAVLLCSVMLLCLAAPATAINGSLTIKLEDPDMLAAIRSGATVSLSLYRIAGRIGSDWTFADPDVQAFSDLAKYIRAYESAIWGGSRDSATLTRISDRIDRIDPITGKSVEAVSTKQIPADGTVVFENLPEGIYFYRSTDRVYVDREILTLQSAVVPVPFIYDGNVLYGITASPKVVRERPYTSLSITKVWSDNNNQDGLRPTAEQGLPTIENLTRQNTSYFNY